MADESVLELWAMRRTACLALAMTLLAAGHAGAMDPMTCSASVLGPAGEVSQTYAFAPFSARVAQRSMTWRPPLQASAPATLEPALHLIYAPARRGAAPRLKDLRWYWPLRPGGMDGSRVLPLPTATRVIFPDGLTLEHDDASGWRRLRAFQEKVAEVVRRQSPASLTLERLDRAGRRLDRATFDLGDTGLRDRYAQAAAEEGEILVRGFQSRFGSGQPGAARLCTWRGSAAELHIGALAPIK